MSESESLTPDDYIRLREENIRLREQVKRLTTMIAAIFGKLNVEDLLLITNDYAQLRKQLEVFLVQESNSRPNQNQSNPTNQQQK